MNRLRIAAGLCLLGGMVACKEGTPEYEEGAVSSSESSTNEETGVETSVETTGEKLDVLDESDLPTGEEEGCQKIDFLFVIDSSGSMADKQANLIASFPGLVAAMMDNVPADDWHVMVVDSDGQWGGTECANACMSLGLCPSDPTFPCDVAPPELCDISVGAGQVAPMGEAASNEDCALAGDARYIQSEEPDLLDAFSCIAKVGIDGSDSERPMDAMVAAVGPEHGELGGCNEGFVRDDAILVITIITDEPDDHSIGDPADWADAVIAAKGGVPESVVVLGLLPDGDLDMPLCGEATVAPRITEFLQLFDSSDRASICEPDYSPFFTDAVSVISEACDDFVPIG